MQCYCGSILKSESHKDLLTVLVCPENLNAYTKHFEATVFDPKQEIYTDHQKQTK